MHDMTHTSFLTYNEAPGKILVNASHGLNHKSNELWKFCLILNSNATLINLCCLKLLALGVSNKTAWL